MQGSILGTLVFIIYICDLPAYSNELEYILLADDTGTFLEHSDLNVLTSCLNNQCFNLAKSQ